MTDRALLGIHLSIPLPSGADVSLSPEFPIYIPRDIDADLRAWITAHYETGGFLLLVGPVAAGKRRTAYELVRETLGDWPMLIPSTPAQLTENIQTCISQSKLIVWLNDAQKFLGANGLSAATIRYLLASRGPIIFLSTIWNECYDALCASPDLAISDIRQDSREILTMLAQRKDVLPSFSESERHRAEILSVRDPRIAEALGNTPSHGISEALAAAPALIKRWLTAADPYGAAVITAAVVARRCGHPEPLPATILKCLSETLLTPTGRAHAQAVWFEPALDWAREAICGQAAPLTAQVNKRGVIEGDNISDILVQHAALNDSAPGHDIPESIWLLLIDNATPQACKYISDAASVERRLHESGISERALRKAAAAGVASAMLNLGILVRQQGKTGEAEEWYRKAADCGVVSALLNLGALLDSQGKVAEAEKWWHRAAGAGDLDAMFRLGVISDKQGKPDRAEEWWQKASDAGHASAMSSLGLLCATQGKLDRAEEWWRKAADAGNAEAMSNLATLHIIRHGKSDEAEEWWRKAAAAGNAPAMFSLGLLCVEQGNDNKAEEWWRKSSDAKHIPAMFNLGMLLAKQGKIGAAEEWYRKAAAAGSADAMFNLGALLAKQGKIGAAEEWYRKAAATGHIYAMLNLGALLDEQGKDNEAKEWRRRAKHEARNAQVGEVGLRSKRSIP